MKKLASITVLCLVFGTAGFSQNERVLSPSESAPPSQEPASPNGWHIEWVPAYLWFSGVDGNVGAVGRTVPVTASFSEIFENLNVGYMTAFDVRKNRVGVLTDFAYTDLSTERPTPLGVLFSSVDSESKMYILDPEMYVRVFESPTGSVDALAGIRYWHLRNSLDLRPGLLPALNASDSRDWVDPVLGARFRVNLKKGWFAMLKGDGGGFGAGSQVTWQIYTGAGKEFKQKYSLFLGYRHLSVDYRDDGFTYDTNMKGILLGFGIRFK